MAQTRASRVKSGLIHRKRPVNRHPRIFKNLALAKKK